MDFNEAGVVNPEHFAARLETVSLRRFRHVLGVPLGAELKAYFDPGGAYTQKLGAFIMRTPRSNWLIPCARNNPRTTLFEA